MKAKAKWYTKNGIIPCSTTGSQLINSWKWAHLQDSSGRDYFLERAQEEIAWNLGNSHSGYYEDGQTLKQVPRAAVESSIGDMWGPSGYRPGQPPPSGSAGGWTRRGHSQPVWYFCISNLQLRDTLSLRQFQCKQSFSLFHNPAG